MPLAIVSDAEKALGKLPPAGLAVFMGVCRRRRGCSTIFYRASWQEEEDSRCCCLDGANRFDPLLIARLARQRGIAAAEFNRRIRVARAFTCFQLTELLVRVPRFIETFAADALIVTALPDLYFDEDVRERDAARLASPPMRWTRCGRSLRCRWASRCFPTLLTSFENTTPRDVPRSLRRRRPELYRRFALDGRGPGKLRLIVRKKEGAGCRG